MQLRGSNLRKIGLVAVIAVVVVVGIVAAMPAVHQWWNGTKRPEGNPGPEAPPSHELVRDAQGAPVKPYTLRLAPVAVQGLQVRCDKVNQAANLALPVQTGTLDYETDRLYPVRSRFQGEVISLGEVTEDTGGSGPSERRLKKRPLRPGDPVKQGQVLAVVWSKELGDRKVALVTALLNLSVHEETLRRLEPGSRSGSVPEITYRKAKAQVEQDLNAVNAAEAGLGVSRLKPEEIEEIRKEAWVVQKRLQGKPETAEQRKERLSKELQKWARVDLLAPRDGIIAEMNTNIDDKVDPSRDTPLFRIADVSRLLITIHFQEEYLPALQPLLLAPGQADLHWKISLQAEPDVLLDLPITRVAPSLDPNSHTVVVVGHIPNPVVDRQGRSRRLIVGQFAKATVDVPPGPDVVDVPTNALNEVDGESLVFVQRDPARPEYELRRVVVVRRSRDVTQVRSQLTPQEQERSAEEVRRGRPPLGTLQAGDRVVTHGVTEMTEALSDLVAKARTEK
jgi:cobalt-zinc-cadmium efflux system membrane fusion protein